MQSFEAYDKNALVNGELQPKSKGRPSKPKLTNAKNAVILSKVLRCFANLMLGKFRSKTSSIQCTRLKPLITTHSQQSIGSWLKLIGKTGSDRHRDYKVSDLKALLQDNREVFEAFLADILNSEPIFKSSFFNVEWDEGSHNAALWEVFNSFYPITEYKKLYGPSHYTSTAPSSAELSDEPIPDFLNREHQSEHQRSTRRRSRSRSPMEELLEKQRPFIQNFFKAN